MSTQSSHPYSQALTIVINAMNNLQTIVSETLTDPDLFTIKMVVTNQLNMPLQYLQGLTNTYPQGSNKVIEMEPLTTHWREVAPISIEQSQVTETEAEKFLLERDAIYDIFLTLNDTQINEKSTIPQGEVLIRSVAKKAGLEDYREAKLTTEYYQKIKDAISAINTKEDAVKKADKKKEND